MQHDSYQSMLNPERNVILNNLFFKEQTARNRSNFSLFLCSVQQDCQAWELNNNGLPFGFSILDNEDCVTPSPVLGKTSVSVVAFLAFNVEYVLSTFLLLQGMPCFSIKKRIVLLCIKEIFPIKINMHELLFDPHKLKPVLGSIFFLLLSLFVKNLLPSEYQKFKSSMFMFLDINTTITLLSKLLIHHSDGISSSAYRQHSFKKRTSLVG